MQKEEQQLQSSQPLPLKGRLFSSVIKSRNYVTFGEPAGSSLPHSLIDTSVDFDVKKVPDSIVTLSNYVTAAEFL